MGDLLIHAIGGALIVVACKPYTKAGAVAALGFGILRESWQHGWTLILDLHGWREALAWGVGAVIAYAIHRKVART